MTAGVGKERVWFCCGAAHANLVATTRMQKGAPTLSPQTPPNVMRSCRSLLPAANAGYEVTKWYLPHPYTSDREVALQL